MTAAFGPRLTCSPRRAALASLLLPVLSAIPAAAAAPPSTIQDRIAAQLHEGAVADLDDLCQGTTTDPGCRTVSAAFLARLLTDASATGALPRQGLRVAHAVIDGPLDLAEARIDRPVAITDSHFLAGIDLTRAHLASQFALDGSMVEGKLDASAVAAASDLRLERTLVQGEVVLIGAAIAGNLDLADAVVTEPLTAVDATVGQDANFWGAFLAGGIDASSAHVGGRAYLAGAAFLAPVNLSELRTGGDLWLDGSSLAGDQAPAAEPAGAPLLDLTDARLGGALHMELSIAGTGPAALADLRGAQVGGDWTLGGAFAATLDASDMRVHGSLALLPGTQFQAPLLLRGGHVGGDLRIGCAARPAACAWPIPPVRFDGRVDARSLSVGGTLAAGGATFAQPLELSNAQIGEDLQLQPTGPADATASGPRGTAAIARLPGTTLYALDLSGARIGGEIELGTAHEMVCWSQDRPEHVGARWPRLLDLTDAQAGTLPHRLFGWPHSIALYGFTYGRFDGDTGDLASAADRARPCRSEAPDWPDWLARDGSDGTQPYIQLSATLAAEGDRDAAARIQYLARNHERDTAWRNGWWLRGASLSALWLVGGYGIGWYMWHALACVAALVVVGALVVASVSQNPPRRGVRGALWCCGAALEKLLPYVSIDPSFSGFFANSAGFRTWQKMVFVVLALAGSILGLFLAAAATGLTQHG